MRNHIGRLFLAAGTTATLIVLPLATRAEAVSEPTVFVSEVGWAGSSSSTIDEWLELTNLTEDAIDLSGWTISGAATSGGTLAIPDGSSIAPHSTFLISNYDRDNAKSSLDRSPDIVTASVSLSNSALRLDLIDGNGTLRDTAGAGGAPLAGRAGGGTGGDGPGYAPMVRRAPVGDGTLPDSWETASESVGFDEGANDLGTPGITEAWFVPVPAPFTEPVLEPEPVPPTDAPAVEAIVDAVPDAPAVETPAPEEPPVPIPEEESVAQEPILVVALEAVGISPYVPPGTLVLNEFVSDADAEWIEILNPYNNVIDLAGWTVRDATRKASALPDQLIGMGQYAIVTNPAGKLNNDGDTVELVDPSGSVIDAVTYGNGNVPSPRNPNALARGTDGTWAATATPTPGAENAFPAEETVSVPSPAISATEETTSPPTVAVAPAIVAAAPVVAVVVADAGTTEDPVAETSGPTTLRLSALYPNTNGDDADEEYVALENTGDAPVDLFGWGLSDASGETYRPDGHAVIEPGQTLVLSRATTKITLNNANDSVTLTAPDGTVADSISYASTSTGLVLRRQGSDWVWSGNAPRSQSRNVPEDDAPAPRAPVAPASPSGKSVARSRVTGTVLVAPGILGAQIFYVDDGDGGVQIYKNDARFPDLKEGDVVRVTGTLTESRGEQRLKVSKADAISFVSSGDPMSADSVAIADLTETDHGRLVKIAGMVLVRSGSHVTLEDHGAQIDVRIAEATGIDPAVFARNASVEVTGVLVSANGTLTLLPRSPSDVMVVPDAVPTEALAATAGKAAQTVGDRQTIMVITLGVLLSIGGLALRKLIPSWNLYAKTRSLRVASQATH